MSNNYSKKILNNTFDNSLIILNIFIFTFSKTIILFLLVFNNSNF